MYRAQNLNGWGPYSNVSYYIAATKPNAPLAPIYVSSTSTSITLQFIQPQILGGSPLVAFKLFVDTLSENANYRLIYTGSESTYTVNTVANNLTTGVTYRFVLVASNVYGDSQ